MSRLLSQSLKTLAVFATKEDVASLKHDDLMALVIRLRERVGQLTAAMEGLRKENAEHRRGGRRQAAPFSKGTRATDPKRPARKPGTGTLSYRKSPSPDETTEPPVGWGWG